MTDDVGTTPAKMRGKDNLATFLFYYRCSKLEFQKKHLHCTVQSAHAHAQNKFEKRLGNMLLIGIAKEVECSYSSTCTEQTSHRVKTSHYLEPLT